MDPTLEEKVDAKDLIMNPDFKYQTEMKIVGDKKIKNQINCEICDETLSTKANLKRHIKVVHEGKKSCDCSHCGETFTSKVDRNRHFRTVHEEKKS